MKYKVGQNLMLLELKTDQSQGQNKPIASATILGYNTTTRLYKIRYIEYVSNREGELEVPEERLFAMIK
jgi:hypothetical protein